VDGTGYRSYVIRVWSRGRDGEQATRVGIEEVQSGRQIELRGEPAADVGARISAALASGSGDTESVEGHGHPATEPESVSEEDEE
jgi:hypothetical protein